MKGAIKAVAMAAILVPFTVSAAGLLGPSSYCLNKTKLECMFPDSGMCRLALATCEGVGASLGLTSGLAAPIMTPQEKTRIENVIPASVCDHAICTSGIKLDNVVADATAAETRKSSVSDEKSDKNEEDEEKRERSKWIPIFTVEAVYRVQSGVEVNAMTRSMNFLDARGLISSYKYDRGLTTQQALNAPSDDYRSYLRNYYKNAGIKDMESNIMSADLIRQMTGQDVNGAMALARSYAGGMTFEHKAATVAAMLNMWSNQYDMRRIDSGHPNSKGIVTYNDMMAATRSNLDGTPAWAGVCRDMHQEAAKVAQALGIPHAYGVGFRTGNSGHRTLVLVDPKDRRKIYKLNYGMMSQDLGCRGSSCLEQHTLNLPSSGIVLHGWGANDELYFNLPTNVGAALHRATGGNSEDLFPLYEYEDSYAQGSAQWGPVAITGFYSDTAQWAAWPSPSRTSNWGPCTWAGAWPVTAPAPTRKTPPAFTPAATSPSVPTSMPAK